MIPESSTLKRASELVYGDRHESYGPAIIDFTRTADMATSLLRHKLKDKVRLEAEDIIRVMIAVKLSRDVHQPKYDNRVDICGYAELLHQCQLWREDHAGTDPRDVSSLQDGEERIRLALPTLPCARAGTAVQSEPDL